MKSKYKLKIKLKSFDGRLLDRSVHELMRVVRKGGGVVCGPIPLPVKINKYIVNRSPHKDKKSREQFGIKSHQRLILLSKIENQTMKMMMDSHIPSGVEAEVKLV